MKPTIIEDEIFEFEPFEKDGSELMAAETSWRGMAEELCVYFEKDMKNKSHPKVTFKWGSIDKALPSRGNVTRIVISDAAKIRRISITSK